MKENKMFARIDMPYKIKPIDYSKLNQVSTILSGSVNFVVEEINEYITDKILEKLYQQYLDSDVNTIYVISKPKFKKFLLEMLPVYLNKED